MSRGGLDKGMRGVLPISGRVCCSLGLVLALSHCAHSAPVAVASPSAVNEGDQLRAQLAERDQTIVQLEGRLALAEAGQRQLRAEIERLQTVAAAPRETVRIGKPAPQPEPEREVPPPEPTRPMLRLHNDRSGARVSEPVYASTWTPPATTERLSVVPLPDAPRRAQPAPAPVQAAAPAEDDLYMRGLDLLRRREFAEAERELAAFVSTHPRDARVGRAQFFRGELQYSQREYKRALALYEQSLASEPSGDKAPDAMLRSALCQLQLGAREKARALITALRARFPDSDAAKRSEQVMQENSG